MKKLNVFYAGWGEHWLLGSLATAPGGAILFQYSPEALAQGLELSPRHLKLRAAAYTGFPAHVMGLPGFIADSLPDGWGMLLMDRLFRRNGWDPGTVSPLDRLSFLGHRALGALVFEPEMSEALEPQTVQLEALAAESQLVLADVDTVALRRLALMGGSPHGARPKVLVHWDRASGAMSTVATAATVPWLVKFQAQDEHKEVCAVEHLYAELARACALDMPDTAYFDLAPKLSGFGIRRFDVEGPHRVPILTLAGLMHADFRLPQLDYVTFLRATAFLTRNIVEVTKAFERLVFNVLFHNRDDHPKNFSFRLNEQRQWRLSPCYDLTYNVGKGGEHAMDVGGHGKDITRSLLLTAAKQADVPAAAATQAIDRMREVASRFERLAAEQPIRKATVQQMAKSIQANSRLLAA